MTHSRIIIGDVHGYYNTLVRLLEAIAPGKDDEIYFLGDLIDRGPQSASVVQFVMNNNYHCLLGNHEHMFLDAVGNSKTSREALQAWLYSGGHSTVASYQKKIPQDHIDWMKSLPLYLDLGDIWLVHAGINPKMPLEKQTSDQFCWVREEFHSMTKPFFADKLIVTGHTITFTLPGVKPGRIAAGPGWLDIETGAYHPYSGWLTALDIDQQKVYQVNTTDNSLRIMPLKKAITEIEPSLIGSKRFEKRS